ncbi:MULTISPECIES: Rid family hydrolase [unclassified Bradyrhizobium]
MPLAVPRDPVARNATLEGAALQSAREKYFDYIADASLDRSEPIESDEQARAEIASDLSEALDDTLHNHTDKLNKLRELHVFGQLSHNEKGNLIAPGSLDESGKPAEFSMMEQQMRAIYANAVKLLARFGATLDNVVEETLYVLDVDAAFAAAGKAHKEAYGAARPQCASNLIGVTRLAFPEQLIEITFKAALSG